MNQVRPGSGLTNTQSAILFELIILILVAMGRRRALPELFLYDMAFSLER
jgi:hypothetical protein